MSDVFNRMDNDDNTKLAQPRVATPTNIYDSSSREITRHGTFEEVLWNGLPSATAGGWSTNAVLTIGEKRSLRRGGVVDESAVATTVATAVASQEASPGYNSYLDEFNRNITIRHAKLRKITSDVSASQERVDKVLSDSSIDRCMNRLSCRKEY